VNGEEEAQIEAELATGRALVATRDILLGHHIPLAGWWPLADLSQDPEVVSRGPWTLHLYVREVEVAR